jgi:Family of unknown function (DUF6521)
MASGLPRTSGGAVAEQDGVTEWQDRPRLVAHLLNPALLAVVLAASAREYERAKHEQMPWTLAFIVGPLVLHGPSRRLLPRTTSTHLSTWIARNPTVRTGFAARARAIALPAREGLRYGLRCGQLQISEGSIHSARPLRLAQGQLSDLIQASQLVGRWLAKLDQPSTAFALFGVMP